MPASSAAVLHSERDDHTDRERLCCDREERSGSTFKIAHFTFPANMFCYLAHAIVRCSAIYACHRFDAIS